MIAALTGIGSTIANSRAAQYALGAGLFILGFLFWLANHDRKLLQNERLRSERKARKTQQAIRETNNEKLEKTRITRAHPPEPVADVDGLSDDQRRRLIRD
tara:strand:- start:1969 stop:2271 length:303 start_codon:yes stop_codon:yes gene_type:complete